MAQKTVYAGSKDSVCGILPVGVVQASVALSGQGANLFPIGDEFILLQMDLGGILGMCLLQALCITTQWVDLIEREEKGETIRF